jgi:hypothetical protein
MFDTRDGGSCEDAAMSRRRGPILAPVIVVAAVLIVGGLLTALRDSDAGDGGRGGPAPFQRPPVVPEDVEDGPTEPPPLGDADRLESYRVVYRVESYGPTGVVVDTEERMVARPFAARSETREGEPPGDAATSLSIWAFGVTEIGAVDQERAPLIGEPTVPNGDAGASSDLRSDLEAGVLVYRAEQQEIAGRTCHRYRTGSPIDVVRLTPPSDRDFADLCIDGSGLVLGESWVVSGELFRRRTAVSVDTDPAIDAEAFDPLGVPPPYRDGGGLIGEVTPDSQFPDVVHWALDAAPNGFEHRGRFSFTPATSAVPLAGDEPPIVTGLSDVYESGPDAVVVVNGGTSDRSDALGELDGETVELGELGTGYVRRRVRGAEILVRLPEGRFVKVHGTLVVEELAAVARALVPIDGEGKTITALEGGEELPRPADDVEDVPHSHDDGEVPHTHDDEEMSHTHR